MKIKLFPVMDIENLEYEVNDFIKDKNILDIKFSPSAFMQAGEMRFINNVMIVYNEQEQPHYVKRIKSKIRN